MFLYLTDDSGNEFSLRNSQIVKRILLTAKLFCKIPKVLRSTHFWFSIYYILQINNIIPYWKNITPVKILNWFINHVQNKKSLAEKTSDLTLSITKTRTNQLTGFYMGGTLLVKGLNIQIIHIPCIHLYSYFCNVFKSCQSFDLNFSLIINSEKHNLNFLQKVQLPLTIRSEECKIDKILLINLKVWKLNIQVLSYIFSLYKYEIYNFKFQHSLKDFKKKRFIKV